MVELTPTAHRVQLVSGLIAALAILTILIISPGLDSSALSTLEKIRQRGYLAILTLNSDTTYYQGLHGADGFEHQLGTWFAEFIDVRPRFVSVAGYGEIYPELLFGSGDIAAAGLSRDESKFSRSVRYGPGYHEVTSQLLYRKSDAERPREIGDLVGGRLKVIGGTIYARQLKDLLERYPELTWTEVDNIGIEELIEQVDLGETDFILAGSHEIALQRRFFPELRIAFEVGEPRPLHWAFNHTNDDSLARAIDEFFAVIREDGRLQQLVHRYYAHVEEFNYSDIQTFTRRIETHLPRYEALFRRAAEEVGLDWRLLAAIGYQESLWNERARSPTGVRGLMMLTQRTAKQMDVDNRLDPAQSVRGGSEYIVSVHERIPERIPEPDRTWLALAAYNVGLGHVEDARKITQKRGGNPDRWIDVKESLPLLARKQWYKDTRYGYARGWEPVKYVENIRQYYQYLLGVEKRGQTGAEPPRPVILPLTPSH